MSDTVDANIPLAAQSGFDVTKIANLADLAQTMKMRQSQMQKQNALAQMLANPQSYGPDGSVTPQAQRGIMAADPQLGLQLRDQQIQETWRKAQEEASKSAAGRASFDARNRIVGASYEAYTDAKKNGASEQDAISIATKARNDLVRDSGGVIPDADVQKILAHPWDPATAKVVGSMSSEWVQSQRQKEQAAQDAQRNKIGQENADTAARRAETAERQGAVRDEIMLRSLTDKEKKPASGGKAPAGFEWDPDKPDTLRPILGGPKDPNSRPWSGREKVFSERIVTSANEAARAISNITELPVGASSGFFGVGSSPGHSMFSSGKDALRNKMSSQDVQDYNTMLAGVKRNLATIETTGLTPSGALTEGFASLELRDGDTNLTKLRKLAEMRQIVDAGLEVQLQDPAIPDSIKGVMGKVLDKVKTAVPYTQSDVTALEKGQQANPNLTFAQLMKDKGLDKGAPKSDDKKPAAAKSDHPEDIQAILNKYKTP